MPTPEAYRSVQQQTATPRDQEYRLFSEITAALMAAKQQGRNDLRALNEALSRNRILWATLADDCTRDENQLPVPTRAAIVSLGKWVRSATREALATGEGLDALIEVNRMIMDGLAGRRVPGTTS